MRYDAESIFEVGEGNFTNSQLNHFGEVHGCLEAPSEAPMMPFESPRLSVERPSTSMMPSSEEEPSSLPFTSGPSSHQPSSMSSDRALSMADWPTSNQCSWSAVVIISTELKPQWRTGCKSLADVHAYRTLISLGLATAAKQKPKFVIMAYHISNAVISSKIESQRSRLADNHAF